MDRFQLGIEIALSVLLLVTIFYSLYLGRALSVLRRDRGQLDALIASLQSSSAQAQSGIDHLRQTTELVGRALGKTVESGKSLKRDLAMLCERSETLAQQLESLLPAGRVATAGMKAASSVQERSEEASFRSALRLKPDEVRTMKPSGSKSAAERELLRALRQKQG
ncbi:DUF6468 domain-containing protein [Gluconobacter sphaericus]|uniref:DUF6468 domain-containing protein n=1 Tax=Gluconobacter sphaericus NBRC 12467 TaxID=1307951 RepID=A0AA37SH69_9PROT|nr:DUF6468 domain-containing protein [Gluconobacter sphaericus]MBF0885027.1 hypothetical protein [Gluconobacter sphaericus]MBS1085478.1 hypothetical protein [Gluconobacter sphaericus]MBS1096491.1 hypothetical protein [Gluconobacter sphaericus]MBS1099129.1 hypothetical protein [Gluconobacter sphaericus]QQX91786.1 hypothetical protein IGS75_04085 [Gluconobacter sphaericus]